MTKDIFDILGKHDPAIKQAHQQDGQPTSPIGEQSHKAKSLYNPSATSVLDAQEGPGSASETIQVDTMGLPITLCPTCWSGRFWRAQGADDWQCCTCTKVNKADDTMETVNFSEEYVKRCKR